MLEAKRHPNADKLQVCKVDTGSGVVEVVCGAPNAKTGMIGVFAPIGSYIPGTRITLEAKPVRGVVSQGMLVSERELELSDDHEGIIELAPELAGKVGQRYADVLGLADPVIEVKLTPNRPDCTGVRGIARDLAAAGLGKLKPERKIDRRRRRASIAPSTSSSSFRQDARDACPCFAGRYIRGVNNGASPAWMQQRLKAVGLRPINALVDVTNYISLDRGRPLHVYDADKLDGAIRARLGRKGEKFLGLDGKTARGRRDHVRDRRRSRRAGLRRHPRRRGHRLPRTTTKNMLIECAYFDPAAHGRHRPQGRRAERCALPLRARRRSGLHPARPRSRHRHDAGGGGRHAVQAQGRRRAARDQDRHRLLDRAGREARPASSSTEKQIRGTLEALGFAIDGKGATVKVTVPSWRPDIHGAADLVEEVVRIAGLDKVPSAPMPRLGGVARAVLTESQRRVRRARRALAARGMVEAITWSFIRARHGPRVRRRPGRAGAGQPDLDRDVVDAAEPAAGPARRRAAQPQPRLRRRWRCSRWGRPIAATRPRTSSWPRPACARAPPRSRAPAAIGPATAEEAGLFDAKADVVALLAELGFDAAKAQLTRDAPAWFHPGRSATLRLGPKIVLAHFGEMHPETLRALDVAGPVAAFEVFLGALPPQKKEGPGAARLSRPPTCCPCVAISPSCSIADVPAGDVVKAALAADKKLIADVNVFDLFEGESLGAGKKSLALEVTLQPREKTLTDEEIEAVAARIVAAVGKATGGEIRK